MTSDEEKHSLREFRFSFLLFPAVSYEEAWQKKREDAKESSMEKSLVYSNATLSKMSRETCLCAWGIHLGERISLSLSLFLFLASLLPLIFLRPCSFFVSRRDCIYSRILMTPREKIRLVVTQEYLRLPAKFPLHVPTRADSYLLRRCLTKRRNVRRVS